VRVIDNGVGIDPAACARLFNHRFTAGKGAKGFGYGLWFSNHVFMANGITPQVESKPGKGTAIVLEFKLTNGKFDGRDSQAT
jgi:signal transduction histidine kinase